jgi:hypothetical protein
MSSRDDIRRVRAGRDIIMFFYITVYPKIDCSDKDDD